MATFGGLHCIGVRVFILSRCSSTSLTTDMSSEEQTVGRLERLSNVFDRNVFQIRNSEALGTHGHVMLAKEKNRFKNFLLKSS